eukprot:363314-Chlamydomonas_euryale.AAC.8
MGRRLQTGSRALHPGCPLPSSLSPFHAWKRPLPPPSHLARPQRFSPVSGVSGEVAVDCKVVYVQVLGAVARAGALRGGHRLPGPRVLAKRGGFFRFRSH